MEWLGWIVWISIGLSVLIKCISLYFGGIACFALKKIAPYPPAKKLRRFAIITAARNEGAVIGNFVDSMKILDYPREAYDIFVIPNNCTDDTASVAKAHGATIIHCPFPVKCKGDALHQGLAMLKDQGYDAFCVFDSDNHAKADFLLRINDTMDAGAQVVKSRLCAKNAQDSWVAGCYSIYFDLFHIFFNQARAACGLSAKLVGTGFVVSREALEALGGWNTTTIAEDAEFSAQCAKKGIRVWWAPEAVTYDEQPLSFRVSMVQRKRWCSGIMQVAKKELKPLLGGMNHDNMPFSIDFIMFLVAPFTQAISIIPVGLMALGLLLGDSHAIDEFLLVSGLYLPIYYTVMVGVAGGLVAWRNNWRIPKGMLGAIVLFPLFMISWVPLQMISLCKETKKWEEIRHTGKVERAFLFEKRI